MAEIVRFLSDTHHLAARQIQHASHADFARRANPPHPRTLLPREQRCEENKRLKVMVTEQTLLRGSCLCGLVAYEVPDSFEYSLYCHCSNCRRATGAAAKPFAGIRSDLLTLVSGGNHVMRYGEGTSHDAHCERCGSLLYSSVRNGAYLHVTLGTLIDSPSIRPTAHIFVGSKAPWDNICDGLPQFDGFP